MGGLCTKGTADPSATIPAGGNEGAGAIGGSGSREHGSSAITSLPNSTRRESDRKGLRQGLVHERKHQSVWDVYEIVKEIGHGMTGKVYQVRQKLTGEVYALKCMEMKRIDPDLLDDLRNEIELLKMMDHPNVIKLYEYMEDDHNIYLILEFCDGGELFDRLHEQKGSRYTEAEAARLMFKMCAAIGYCHYMGISHRDLKLENFIFESPDSDSNIKLIDFGLSAKYGSTIRRMHTMVGTAYYIAPEVLNQSEGSSAGYTNQCDCWSLGVITYMLLSGTPPFKGRRDREVLMAVKKGKYTLSGPKWEHISEEAKDFIRHALVYNPNKRMTAEQALKHPWLQSAKTENTDRPLDPEVLQNLRDFSKFSSFKRAALEAIAFSMSAQSIRHLREQFSKLDKDQTGFVSLAEFLDVVSTSGMSKEEAIRVFEGIDQDHTNTISYTEFLAASLSRRLWLSRERIKDAFQRLDVDGKGYITKENLRDLLGDDWTLDRAGTMMNEADTKKDGKIDFEEFISAMTNESRDAWNVALSTRCAPDDGSMPITMSSSDLTSLGGTHGDSYPHTPSEGTPVSMLGGPGTAAHTSSDSHSSMPRGTIPRVSSPLSEGSVMSRDKHAGGAGVMRPTERLPGGHGDFDATNHGNGTRGLERDMSRGSEASGARSPLGLNMDGSISAGRDGSATSLPTMRTHASHTAAAPQSRFAPAQPPLSAKAVSSDGAKHTPTYAPSAAAPQPTSAVPPEAFMPPSGERSPATSTAISLPPSASTTSIGRASAALAAGFRAVTSAVGPGAAVGTAHEPLLISAHRKGSLMHDSFTAGGDSSQTQTQTLNGTPNASSSATVTPRPASARTLADAPSHATASGGSSTPVASPHSLGVLAVLAGGGRNAPR